MHRRQFLFAAAALSGLTSLPAFAVDGPAPDPFKKILIQIPGESKKVHGVISFSCPICAQYHASIDRWGATLPKTLSFDFLPAVTDQDSAILSVFWLTMQSVAPQKLLALADSLYTATQEKGLTPTASGPALLKKINKDIGFTPGFDQAFRTGKYADASAIQRKIEAFGVDVTPTLVIAGQYLITPENTNGNGDLFIQLASAMVSKSM